jgi:hypothetical protein
MKNRIKTKNNKLPPNINTNNPSSTLTMYLVRIIIIHVTVKDNMMKTYNGFLKTPLNPAINPINLPQFQFNIFRSYSIQFILTITFAIILDFR